MKNLIITLLSIFIGINLQAQNCNLENTAFGNNEHLKYKVYYNWKSVWAKAGYVTFDVNETALNGSQNYHIKAIGKTYPFYNMFYKVHDVYETYVDKTTVLPNKFVRDVNEGGFKLDHTYDFNRDNLKVHTVSKVNDHKKNIKEFDFNSCTHDMLSVIYQMRNIDFTKMKYGDEVPVEVFLDNEFYQLAMIYKGKAEVDTKFGKIKCLKVIPKVVSGRVFKEDEALTVYVSDDLNKIPVLIESPISVGSVKAILEDFDDLRNPMTSITEVN
ncbi:MAG: DUF3108 domain-containing protein [Chitinophagales bacterium]